MNCSKFHNQCKAQCCSFVPMDRKLYMSNWDKGTQPVKELLDVSEGAVIPITETGKCVFLNNVFGCNIYEERPAVCKKFGDETHINMTCSFQTKDGNARNKKDQRKISEKQDATYKNFINKNK